MSRHIAIYKRYDTAIGIQQGKDYQITTQKSADNSITVAVISPTDIPVEPLVYPTEWEFLQDWQILRTWKGR
jgi:hypothetical protein